MHTSTLCIKAGGTLRELMYKPVNLQVHGFPAATTEPTMLNSIQRPSATIDKTRNQVVAYGKANMVCCPCAIAASVFMCPFQCLCCIAECVSCSGCGRCTD